MSSMVTRCNDLEALSQAAAELFAAQARQAVQACGRFSVALAGGIFPGTSVLEDQQRWVAEVYVAEEGLHRLTLTAAAINQAALVVFLVSGRDKGPILQKLAALS